MDHGFNYRTKLGGWVCEMEKQLLVVEKICNHCFNNFIINSAEEITDDGMIRDVRCPYCNRIVHVWLKINLLDVKIGCCSIKGCSFWGVHFGVFKKGC